MVVEAISHDCYVGWPESATFLCGDPGMYVFAFGFPPPLPPGHHARPQTPKPTEKNQGQERKTAHARLQTPQTPQPPPQGNTRRQHLPGVSSVSWFFKPKLCKNVCTEAREPITCSEISAACTISMLRSCEHAVAWSHLHELPWMDKIRSHLETMIETIVCWYLQGMHHSRVSWVVRDFVFGYGSQLH